MALLHRSIAVSSAEASPLALAGSGFDAPEGGIAPALSLRMTFSACCAFRSGAAKSIVVQENPPDFTLSLWQPAQYFDTRACCEATGADAGCP